MVAEIHQPVIDLNAEPGAYINVYAQQKRDDYVRKTMNTLLCQFGFTFGCVLATIMSQDIFLFVQLYMLELLISGIVGSLASVLYIVFSDTKTEFQLGLFTFFETMVVVTGSALYDPHIVLMTLFVTVGLVGGLGAYALTTKNNHLNLGNALSIGLSTLIFMGLLNYFFRTSFTDTLQLYAGTLIFLGYIVYDVQLFFSEHTDLKSYEKGDLHIIASLNIYLDVINVFIRLLEIMDRIKGKDNKSEKKRR
jgi:hypothetical protein